MTQCTVSGANRLTTSKKMCGKNMQVSGIWTLNSQRKYYWGTQKAKKKCATKLANLSLMPPLKLSLLIFLLHFLYQFFASSSNYCNRNCCRSFLILEALAKSNPLLFAIAFRSKKESHMLMSQHLELR